MNKPEDISVTVVRHSGLLALVADIRAHADRYPVVPISSSRAATHAANPDADPDDPALLMLMVDGKCRGYLGLMPQFIAGGDGRAKVFAFTTLLVDAPLRGKGAADRLLERAREFGPLLTLGNSHAAQGFFRKRGLVALPPYKVVYLPLGAGHMLSRASAGIGKRLKKHGMPIVARTVTVGARILRPLTSWSRRQAVHAMLRQLPAAEGRLAEACDRVPAAAADVMRARPGEVVWRMETMNWLLDGNATASASETSQIARRYHFHADDPGRHHVACILRERGQLRGAALFHCHHIHGQATVSILHTSLNDASWRPVVLQFALRLALAKKADVLRAGADFEVDFARLLSDQRMPSRQRLGFFDAPTGSHAFDHYRESFADGDIALY